LVVEVDVATAESEKHVPGAGHYAIEDEFSA
jgi:hypothetical protein